MDTFQTAIELLKPGCFVASIDLGDAYYSIPIASGVGHFECLNGMANIFSSLAYLTAYPVRHEFLQKFLNQFMPIARSYIYGTRRRLITDCVNNIHDTIDLFNKFGFIVHPEKSILKPTQETEFLGFIINTLTMTISIKIC